MFKKHTDDPGLSSVIADCEASLRSHETDSKEYKETLARYKDLQALKASQKPKSVSPDTWVTTFGSLAGIILVINHERANVITTKAIGFVKKLT